MSKGFKISDAGMKRVAQLMDDQVEGERVSILERAITEARNHLYAAIAQSLPTDDQIIMDHVRDAHDILDEATKVG